MWKNLIIRKTIVVSEISRPLLVFPKMRESVKRRDRKIVEKKVRMAPFFPGSTKRMMQITIVQRDRVTIRDGRKFFSFWDTLFFILL